MHGAVQTGNKLKKIVYLGTLFAAEDAEFASLGNCGVLGYPAVERQGHPRLPCCIFTFSKSKAFGALALTYDCTDDRFSPQGMRARRHRMQYSTTGFLVPRLGALQPLFSPTRG